MDFIYFDTDETHPSIPCGMPRIRIILWNDDQEHCTCILRWGWDRWAEEKEWTTKQQTMNNEWNYSIQVLKCWISTWKYSTQVHESTALKYIKVHHTRNYEYYPPLSLHINCLLFPRSSDPSFPSRPSLGQLRADAGVSPAAGAGAGWERDGVTRTETLAVVSQTPSQMVSLLKN